MHLVYLSVRVMNEGISQHFAMEDIFTRSHDIEQSINQIVMRKGLTLFHFPACFLIFGSTDPLLHKKHDQNVSLCC